MIGYDGVISIEHEDSLMSVEDGLEKAAKFLEPTTYSEEAVPHVVGVENEGHCRYRTAAFRTAERE